MTAGQLAIKLHNRRPFFPGFTLAGIEALDQFSD